MEKLVKLTQFGSNYEYDTENRVMYSIKGKRKKLKPNGKNHDWFLYYHSKPYRVNADVVDDMIKYQDIRAVDLIPKKAIIIDKLDVNFDKLPNMHVRFDNNGQRRKGWTKEEINNAMRTKPVIIKTNYEKPKSVIHITEDNSIKNLLDKQKNLILITNGRYLRNFFEIDENDYNYLNMHYNNLDFGKPEDLKHFDMETVVKNLLISETNAYDYTKTVPAQSSLTKMQTFIDFHYTRLFGELNSALDQLNASNDELVGQIKLMNRGEIIRYQKQLSKCNQTVQDLLVLIRKMHNVKTNLEKSLRHKSLKRMHEVISHNNNLHYAKINTDCSNANAYSNTLSNQNSDLEIENKVLKRENETLHAYKTVVSDLLKNNK